MGTLEQRRVTCKTAWAKLSTHARLGEKFGWIACVSLMYKLGWFPDRKTALDHLYREVTPDDLDEFRKIKGTNPFE